MLPYFNSRSLIKDNKIYIYCMYIVHMNMQFKMIEK